MNIRRWYKVLWPANAALQIIFAGALLVVVNVIIHPMNVRSDISRDGLFSLQPSSKIVLQSLSNHVQVVVFYQRTHMLHDELDYLLETYRMATPYLGVEWVDPERDVARADELVQQYGLKEINQLIIDDGRQVRVLPLPALASFKRQEKQGQSILVLDEFTAEQAITQALMELQNERRIRVGFLSGHGERDITSTDRYEGYSKLYRQLRYENFEVTSLVPGRDALDTNLFDVVVIARPTKQYAEVELQALLRFAESGGGILMLMDSEKDVGLRKLLQRWKIYLSDMVVVDPSQTLTRKEVFVRRYGSHPITRGLSGLTSVFYVPRAVLELEKEAGERYVRSAVLAACTDKGWGEVNTGQRPFTEDEGVDLPGPVPIGVAVELGAQTAETEARVSRAVVFGDSDFAGNAAMTGASADLLCASLRWLAGGLAESPVTGRKVTQLELMLDQDQQLLAIGLFAGLLPLSACAAGFFMWFMRRK